MIQNLLIGSSGLVGNAVLFQLITKNLNFVILDRLNPNCLREIADQKIRSINIINCAFNFKNIKHNYDFINFLFDTLKKNNIKINTYINISSINAYSAYPGKFSFIETTTPVDRYGQEKKKIDKFICSMWKAKIVKNLITFVPFIISGGFWDKILSDKSVDHFPSKFHICKISPKDFASMIIKELIKNQHLDKKKLIFLKTRPIKLNQANTCSFQFKVARFIFENINNKILLFEKIQKLFSIIYKFTHIPLFFLLRYYYNINLINTYLNKLRR